ncbi:MAG: class I SAM-dependent methyltransferase [Desulfobaccales bacterium]
MQWNKQGITRIGWNVYYSLHPFGLLNILQKVHEAFGVPPLGIQEIDLNYLLKDIIKAKDQKSHPAPVQIFPFFTRFASVPVTDQLALSSLAAYFEPIKNILEIGTFNGETARLLAMNAPQATVYTIDLPLKKNENIEKEMTAINIECTNSRSTGIAYRGTAEESRIIQLFGDSRSFDFKTECPVFDMVFIDGCHDFEFVHKDTLQALNITRPGGLIVWHDCTTSFPAVVRVVKSFINKGARKIRNTQIAFMFNS